VKQDLQDPLDQQENEGLGETPARLASQVKQALWDHQDLQDLLETREYQAL